MANTPMRKGKRSSVNPGSPLESADLPASRLQELRFIESCRGETLHGTGNLLGDFGQNLGIVVVSGCCHDGFGSRDSLLTLLGVVFDVQRSRALLHEDTGADKDGLCAQLH